jgi:hypothetical protein
MVTMKDVARAAGVSQPAVSYAYNRPDQLSADMRERILQVAAKPIRCPMPSRTPRPSSCCAGSRRWESWLRSC